MYIALLCLQIHIDISQTKRLWSFKKCNVLFNCSTSQHSGQFYCEQPSVLCKIAYSYYSKLVRKKNKDKSENGRRKKKMMVNIYCLLSLFYILCTFRVWCEHQYIRLWMAAGISYTVCPILYMYLCLIFFFSIWILYIHL